MDTMFQALLSWQFLLFCLAIAAVLFVIRKIFEYVMANYKIDAKNSKLWRELILPILPVVLGSTAAFLAKQYPYPGGLTSGSARVAFGLVAGLLSGLFYRVLKSALTNKINNLAIGTPDAPVADDNWEASVRQSIKKD